MLMPYPNEHAARVKAPGSCVDKSFRRMNQGAGVSLILCKNKEGKMEAQAYRFDKTKFTPEQAKAWLAKHNVKPISFEKSEDVKAKLPMKASKPEVDGRIWSAGMHHVFVNDEPAKVYVPEETIMQTFNSIKGLIDSQGRMPIGIDHLSNSTLEENQILNKMGLLDVGDVTKVGTDGSSIYILDSQITNDSIRSLNSQGELPAYSIVGSMDAKECPTGKADYVINSIDVERVDFVEEGGCQVCTVGAQPNELLLTSKKSKEENNMVEENVTVPEESVEEQPEAVIDEPVSEEHVEEKPEEVPTEEVPEETKEEPTEEETPEDVDEIVELKKEILELKKELQDYAGKKADTSVKAKDAAVDAVEAVINAGKAYPKQRESFLSFARADMEGFKKFAASLPQVIDMKMKAKLAQDAKDKAAKEKAAAEDAAVKKQLENIFRVKL
jgi:hypothetical protein